MVRGTTAQFKFKLPYNVCDIGSVTIVFWQENYNGPDDTRPLPIIKVLEQCGQTGAPDELTISLTKEETLRFTDERKGCVQLHGEAIDGVAFASQQENFTVYPIYGNIDPVPSPNTDGVIILDGGSIV